MLHVELDNILTEEEATSQITSLLQRADEEKSLFVVTRNGKPSVAILKLEQLEDLSGHTTHTDEAPLLEKAPTEPMSAAPTPAAPAPAPIVVDTAPDMPEMP